ncbi:hypothetical protein [Paraclostridium sordellii]|uniref:hypothetical protein n=1 Tax=Paraclostridium sordellii TaxID=1505 RepID=UPI0012D81555|nr:hypothetical protein [Paeniclostridium sordellii]
MKEFINKEITVVEDKIKDLLYCIEGYDKSMDIEQTIDLLNSSNKWIECTYEDDFKRYILKDRITDINIAEFVCKWSIGDFNWDTHSVEGKMWVSDIIKY